MDINNLIDLAKKLADSDNINDRHVASILYAVGGAYKMGAIELLSDKINKIVKEELLPLANQCIHNMNAIKN